MDVPKLKQYKKLLYFLPAAVLAFTFLLYISVDKKPFSRKSSFTTTSDDEADLSPIIFEGDKYVHLDLKGAPPRVSYYHKLFRLLSDLGANGILIEYEDMFPYTGNLLKHIPAHNAYTASNIETINLLAEENNLTVIPLIQTFGHLEFVLKLKKFNFLREVPKYPQVICPTHNMTSNVLHEMIRQIIQAHPKSTMIHIGADEVYHIGKCSRCKQIMYEEKLLKNELFLYHIKRIASYIKMKYPAMRILMWDDEFRNINIDDLEFSAISLLVEPVVWKYSEDVYAELSYDLFHTYASVFKSLWFASAFKGATGSNQYLTSISHHLANHISWMGIYNDYKNQIPIQGIFITGWQRYDHFAMLCELLPVGIPSLAFSLGVLSGNTANIHHLYGPTLDQLKCSNIYALKDMEHASPYCKYPGGDILDAVIAFHHFKLRFQSLKQQSRFLGWMSSYQSSYNYSNPDIVDSILMNLTDMLSELTSIDTYLTQTMLKVYDKYTTSEWQETHIKPLYDEINNLMETANRILSINDWPRRPW